MQPKILAFAGSTRKDSFNKKLVKIAALGAEQAGATVTLIDLADFAMPLYDQDLEQAHGLPEGAKQFKQLMVAHDGFLIASPEYNGMFSALLKNALDWASRFEAGDADRLTAYKSKLAAVMAASPGALGGLRGLNSLRVLLNNVGVLVLPQQLTISNAHQTFNIDGSLTDTNKQQEALALGVSLANLLAKFNS